jgi:hypothetical protein
MSNHDLNVAIANRRWTLNREPFLHVIATNVFDDGLYKTIATEFDALLERGLSESNDTRRFSRNMGSYDAHSLHLHSDYTGALDIFASREWHDMISAVFAIKTTDDLSIELHHHAPGSVNGSIHDDFNPGWFSDKPRADGINLVSLETNYKTGYNGDPTVKPRETIRAIALLFYLNNPLWIPGNGGETGLYKKGTDNVNAPMRFRCFRNDLPVRSTC